MKVDTQIRQVTPRGANLFVELGFAPAEARRLHAASRKQINDIQMLKKGLMMELARWIDAQSLKQAQAAVVLGVSRPRVSDVVNGKASKFTIDTLVELLGRVGRPVRVVVGD